MPAMIFLLATISEFGRPTESGKKATSNEASQSCSVDRPMLASVVKKFSKVPTVNIPNDLHRRHEAST
jgi:hypothetical protein